MANLKITLVKSTIGALLARKLERPMVDADAEIEALAGKTIPEIFAEDGEAVFRNWETQVLGVLGQQSGLIIATGGGCVTQERNYPLLHQNGTILWLTRRLDKLPTDGRPLSQSGKLAEMFEKRSPLYARFADAVISNDASAEQTLAQLLGVLGREENEQ